MSCFEIPDRFSDLAQQVTSVDYRFYFAVLKKLPCDLFLGAHGAYFGMLAKYEKMKAGGSNPFIDPEGYKAYVAERDETFRKEWERQKQNPGSPARKN